MKFEGEHLLPGQFGHFFVILALVAALVSAISFFLSSRATTEVVKNSWLQFARKAFFLQGICILFVFGIILSFVVNYSFVPFFTILSAALIFQKGEKFWLVFLYPLFLFLFLLIKRLT
jgi:cytochrome c-type biogenesis protein CcmF